MVTNVFKIAELSDNDADFDVANKILREMDEANWMILKDIQSTRPTRTAVKSGLLMRKVIVNVNEKTKRNKFGHIQIIMNASGDYDMSAWVPASKGKPMEPVFHHERINMDQVVNLLHLMVFGKP